MLKKLMYFWHYLNNKWFVDAKMPFLHYITPAELKLVTNTGLFNQIKKNHLQHMLGSIKRTYYSKDKLICKEGEYGDAFYIIVRGSVRVFTYDLEGNKIPLARLNTGDYFGEQALLGEAYKTRNANIETITDTTLLSISEKIINQCLQNDADLKVNLKKIGFQQVLNILSSATGFYNEIESIIATIVEPDIRKFKEKDEVFHEGDEPNNVYIILEGAIDLLITDKKTKKISTLTLHRGQLFGELAIVKNKLRAATAIAHTNTKLLAIPSDKFKEYVSQYPRLNKILSTLENIYQIPTQGSIDQYLGSTKHKGSTITNIYKMDDGRSIISTRLLYQNIFTMHTVNKTAEESYRYHRGANTIELGIADHHLISINVTGFLDNLPEICYLLLNNEKIPVQALERFTTTGRIKLTPDPVKPSELACTCSGVTNDKIKKLISQGITDFTAISRKTEVSPSCEACKYKILQILAKNDWLSVEMKKIAEHNSYVRSYLLKPINGVFQPPKPGQHVIVQVKVGDNWIERPYSISDTRDGCLRITIKKDPHGFFAQWLFEQSSEKLYVKVSQPKGDFTLNTAVNNSVICFAGGVGIVPFIMYSKYFLAAHNNNKMHIHYSANTDKEFIFVDEFNEISKKTSAITIQYRSNEKHGLMNEKEVIEIINSHNNPDIYICGPEGYMRLIRETLQKMKYDPAKIHFEEFVKAGQPSAAA